MTIDTKKAREMRAKGTAGEWQTMRDQRGHSVATEKEECCLVGDWEGADIDAELIAYAVNALADEIDRLRAALQRILDEVEDNAIAAIADDALTGRTVELSCSCVNPTYDKTHLICVSCKKKVDTSK